MAPDTSVRVGEIPPLRIDRGSRSEVAGGDEGKPKDEIEADSDARVDGALAGYEHREGDSIPDNTTAELERWCCQADIWGRWRREREKENTHRNQAKSDLDDGLITGSG